MVQVPAASRDAMLPDTVQTVREAEEKLTERPEVAVAERFTVVPAACPAGTVAKVMV
jgi:hypothetical protein